MRATFLCALLMLAPMAATAQAYKCKRPDGKMIFQDQPCDSGTTGGPMIITDPSPTYGGPPPQKTPAPTTRRDKLPPGQPPARGDEALKERNRQLEAENRNQECNLARRNLSVLQTQRPVFRTDKNGNKQYVDDANRQSELAAAQQRVAESCK